MAPLRSATHGGGLSPLPLHSCPRTGPKPLAVCPVAADAGSNYGPPMSADALKVVVEDAIWVAERPIWFAGVRLRTRSTVIRLEDGGLWIHSPPPPTEALCAALDALGPVRWLVAPNCFHHLAVAALAARYPEARRVGPASAAKKNASLVLSSTFEQPDSISPSGIEAVPLRGVPFLDETVFFHRATASLIGADLVMTACAEDHWTWRTAARILRLYGRIFVPPDVKSKTKSNPEAAASIRAMLALPIERILVAHADPIVQEPKDRLEEAWRFVMTD